MVGGIPTEFTDLFGDLESLLKHSQCLSMDAFALADLTYIFSFFFKYFSKKGYQRKIHLSASETNSFLTNLLLEKERNIFHLYLKSLDFSFLQQENKDGFLFKFN
jgi:hypothetical protein